MLKHGSPQAVEEHLLKLYVLSVQEVLTTGDCQVDSVLSEVASGCYICNFLLEFFFPAMEAMTPTLMNALSRSSNPRPKF